MNQEVANYANGVKKLLEEQGFYFSYHADLTSSQQRLASVRNDYSGKNKNYSYEAREKFVDRRYMWNHNMLEDFTF